MSYISLTYHLVFGTYLRHHAINIDHDRELYKFIYVFSSNRGVKVRRIGGMPDHIHILCDIPPQLAVSEFVKLIKTESSKFLRCNPNFPNWERWAEGYGAFTVDASLREARRLYILNQRIHHQGVDFVQEYHNLLAEAGFPSDTPVLGDSNV